MADIPELLPCPFCEWDGKVASGLGNPASYYVLCQSCEAATGYNLTPDAAIAAWNTRAAPPAMDREAVEKLVEPWADYHGDLPDYDHPLRPVYESGIQYAVELLAKELGVTDWTPCDGTEEFDGDLGGTLTNIVLGAMPKDKDGDPIHPRDALSTLSADAIRQGEGERPSDEELDAHLPESIRAEKRCGIQRSAWLTGWFVPWSPRNDNENAEGPWSHWVSLAKAIIAADQKAIASHASDGGKA